MSDRPYLRVGRLVLTLCAAVLAAASVSAQTAASTGPSPSRVDIFLGYSYFQPFGSVTLANGQTGPYMSVNSGGIVSVAGYFNRHVGLQVEAAAHPDGTNDGLYTAMLGPIFRLPRDHYTLFAHAMGGATKLGGPNGSGAVVYEPYTFGSAFAAGGGLDYDLSHHFSLRLIQADYEFLHVTFPNVPGTPTTGGSTSLSAVRLSAGLVIRFGTTDPTPPVTFACAAEPASLYPGDPVTVTGTAGNLAPKKKIDYVWTSDLAKVTGNKATAAVDTATLAPGTYTVKGHMSEGKKPGQMADCAAAFTVMAIQPPVLTSCSANPAVIHKEDTVNTTSTITAVAVSPQNRPLTYSYSTSAGTITGSTSTATLDTASAPASNAVVTCNVVDDKANAVSATTQVTVLAAPPPPAPETSALCSIHFERDKKHPARVDNEAKACLDDVALDLLRAPGAKVALVGSSDYVTEVHGDKLAADRAVNTKDYLVAAKGIDASRVTTYTGGTDGKTVATMLVPAGANFSAIGDTPVDETAVKAALRKAPVTRRRKRVKHY
jgi:outer membrane protein OmpA-like peptidoglycan-associated protein